MKPDKSVTQPSRCRWSFVCFLLSFFLIAGSSSASMTADAVPGQSKTEITINKDIVIVTARISAGLLTGQANELVYWPAGSDNKLSQLIWSIQNVLMVGAGVTIQPVEWLKINGDIFFNANSGSNELDDYDWRYTTSLWSDWSHHDDVELTKGTMFDVNAEFIFFRNQNTAISAIVGYKQDNWEWEARGGEFIYSIGGFRNTSGTFMDGVLGITYEQTFQVPYLGIGFEIDIEPVTLDGRIAASFLSMASDTDHHHVRDLVYERDFDLGTMFSLNFGATYTFTKHIALGGRFQLTKYFTTTGDTTITRQTTGEQTVYNDIAGIDNEISMFLLSLIFMF